MATHARILVVEDDAALRAALAELLVEEGYDVSCAENGADALAKLGGGLIPSLILLDLAMPVMDGWTFRRAQRSDPRLAHVPTVVLTASHGSDRADIAALDVDAFLSKPFDPERLMDTVHQLC
jgi:CheY-like chemotaxis protein